MSHSKISSINIQFAKDVDQHSLPSRAVLRSWARKSLKAMHVIGDLGIRFVDGTESKTLNSAYRKKDKPTNVLSFPYGWECPETKRTILGDLVLCTDVLQQEATAQGKSLEQHLAHLLIHGLLHLIGFDHQTDDEAATMEQKEIEILEQFGFPNPYGVQH